MQYKMRRNFLLDMIVIFFSAVLLGLILLMFIGAVYSKEFINIPGVLVLGTFLAFGIGWLFNVKCYINNDILYIKFIWTIKEIPLDKIYGVSIVSGNMIASKMVKDGIKIDYYTKYGENTVIIAVIEEDQFVKYLKQHCNLK